MNNDDIDLSALSREELERMSMILNLRKLDEELRQSRERYQKEQERYQQEREQERQRYQEERERFLADLALRRERHEREMEKLRAEVDKISNESRKVRLEWLLYPFISAAGAAGGVIAALKIMGVL